jgi:flagellar biogenesis protein FliO
VAPGFWTAYVARLAILALVLVVLYVVARKLQSAKLFIRSGRRLQLLESAMLSQHAALHLVRAGKRYFLIGSAAGGVTRLAELVDPADSYTLK